MGEHDGRGGEEGKRGVDGEHGGAQAGDAVKIRLPEAGEEDGEGEEGGEGVGGVLGGDDLEDEQHREGPDGEECGRIAAIPAMPDGGTPFP